MSLRRFISFSIYSWVGDDFLNVQNATGIWTQRTPVFALLCTPESVHQKWHRHSKYLMKELSLLNQSFSQHHEKFWNVLNVLNRFFKNILICGASSKQLKPFHIPPVLFAHSDTKICNMGSHITGILYLFSSKTPVIYDDKLVCRSNRGVTRNVVTSHLSHDIENWPDILYFNSENK